MNITHITYVVVMNFRFVVKKRLCVQTGTPLRYQFINEKGSQEVLTAYYVMFR